MGVDEVVLAGKTGWGVTVVVLVASTEGSVVRTMRRMLTILYRRIGVGDIAAARRRAIEWGPDDEGPSEGAN